MRRHGYMRMAVPVMCLILLSAYLPDILHGFMQPRWIGTQHGPVPAENIQSEAIPDVVSSSFLILPVTMNSIDSEQYRQMTEKIAQKFAGFLIEAMKWEPGRMDECTVSEDAWSVTDALNSFLVRECMIRYDSGMRLCLWVDSEGEIRSFRIRWEKDSTMKMKDAAEIVKTLPFAAARWYSQGSEYTLKFTKIQSTDSGVYAFRMYIHETAFRGNIGRDWIAMDHENLILSDLGR